nr:sodium:solute symporter family protein [Desulfobotulus pelophilus]
MYAGRKVRSVEDYYVCGRNAPTLLIAGTLFASMLSTNGFLGDTAYCYTGNITTMILINALCACGYVLGPLFFGRYIRRARVDTMPSYFGQRFNSKRIRRFSGLITVISLTAYLLSVIQGTGLLMETLTGFSRFSCLAISWICFTAFTFYSGSRGVVITDTLMCIFFLAATVLAGFFVLKAAGGVGSLVVNLASSADTPDGLLDYHGNTGGGSKLDMMTYAISMGFVWMIAVGVSPWQAGRNLMARNEHVVFRSGVIAALLTTFFLLYLYLMAVSVLLLNPGLDPPEGVILWAAFELVPKLVGVVLLTGIMTAGLSSASTFLSVVSFSLSSDVFDMKFKSGEAQLLFTRFTVLFVGLITLALASFNVSDIRVTTWFASTIIAASWGYVAFASVWSRRLTERGAYYSMLGGFTGYLVLEIASDFLGLTSGPVVNPFFIGLGISILLGFLGSRNQKRSSEEVRFLKKMHQIPESETRDEDYRIDRMYGWGMVVGGFLITFFLLTYWVFPYHGFLSSGAA